MIIGNGLLANYLNNGSISHDNIIFFCSGVSNSKETNEENFNREKELLTKTILANKELKIIYFSSVLVESSKDRYYIHKKEMENLIKEMAKNYIIFRVPQIIGNNGNKNNLFNSLTHLILNNEEITIFKGVERALVDVEDLVKIVNFCKDKINKEVINFSFIEKVSVYELCLLIYKELGITPKIKMIDEKSSYNWEVNNCKIIEEYINTSVNTVGYTDKIIKKYINKKW